MTPEADTQLYALVTELKRSPSPITASQLRGSCVHQIKTLFSSMAPEARASSFARLVQLLLDNMPDTPPFELVTVNLVEDICAQQRLTREDKADAAKVADLHTSPLAPSIAFSIRNPMFEVAIPKTR